jgi:Family of unknown function (DUF6084)
VSGDDPRNGAVDAPPAVGPVVPDFRIVTATVAEEAAVPALRFALEVTESSRREIYTIALTAQINVDPARRTYDAATRERLVDLFGAPERWAATTHSFLWAHATTLVPTFAGATACSLLVPCSYDLELASTKYFAGLADGAVPLSFHFTGSIVYRGDDGRVQVVLVPWSCSTQWQLPIATWRTMMERLYPNGGYARVGAGTLARLRERQVRRGSPSLDACIGELLDLAAEDDRDR